MRSTTGLVVLLMMGLGMSWSMDGADKQEGAQSEPADRATYEIQLVEVPLKDRVAEQLDEMAADLSDRAAQRSFLASREVLRETATTESSLDHFATADGLAQSWRGGAKAALFARWRWILALDKPHTLQLPLDAARRLRVDLGFARIDAASVFVEAAARIARVGQEPPRYRRSAISGGSMEPGDVHVVSALEWGRKQSEDEVGLYVILLRVE